MNQWLVDSSAFGLAVYQQAGRGASGSVFSLGPRKDKNQDSFKDTGRSSQRWSLDEVCF